MTRHLFSPTAAFISSFGESQNSQMTFVLISTYWEVTWWYWLWRFFTTSTWQRTREHLLAGFTNDPSSTSTNDSRQRQDYSGDSSYQKKQHICSSWTILSLMNSLFRSTSMIRSKKRPSSMINATWDAPSTAEAHSVNKRAKNTSPSFIKSLLSSPSKADKKCASRSTIKSDKGIDRLLSLLRRPSFCGAVPPSADDKPIPQAIVCNMGRLSLDERVTVKRMSKNDSSTSRAAPPSADDKPIPQTIVCNTGMLSFKTSSPILNERVQRMSMNDSRASVASFLSDFSLKTFDDAKTGPSLKRAKSSLLVNNTDIARSYSFQTA